MKRVFLCLALGALLAASIAAVPARAETEGPKLGVIDMDRVAVEYQEMQRLNVEFQEFQRKQEVELQQAHTTRLLTDAERQEFTDLSAMGAPTEARTTRLAELRGLSDEREKRLLALREKEECSEEEAAELKELGTRYETRMGELAAMQAEMKTSRVAKYEELSKLVADNVDAAVKAVVDEQELEMVLRKDSVMYGGVDITDAVLAKLNAKSEE